MIIEASKKSMAVFMIILLILSTLLITTSNQVSASNTVYYMDSVNGNDMNNGLDTSAAWKTLSKVNTTVFQPGDQILFKAGGMWTGQLHPLGSGVHGNPIRIDQYGSGPKPLIDGGGIVNDVVFLYNQQYWEISNLEITNYAATEGPRLGVHIVAEDIGQLNHVYLENLNIHDISGQKNVRNTGGILYDVQGSVTTTWFNDILVENCSLENVTRTGIATYSKWMNRDGFTGGNGPWKGWTNIVIRNNSLDIIGGDGILIRNGISALVEYNVVKDANSNRNTYNAGMWPFLSDDTLFQYNEAYLTRTILDGQGFDADYHSSGTMIQYNYSHDNEGGFLLVMGPQYGPNPDVTARYNISQNDKTRIVQFVGGVASNFQFYNNTIYVGPGIGSELIKGSNLTPHYLYNNIFYMESGSVGALTGGAVFDHNSYYPISAVSSDAHKVISDPMLISPGSGSVGRNSVDGYMLQSSSPLINAGRTISNNGGKDYWGNALYNETPDIGAHEYDGSITPPPPPAPSGLLFSDDFEDGDSVGWTKSGGTWSVVSDGTKVLERTSSGSTESYATAGVGWDDYTYQATVKLKTSGGSAGLIFRVTDTNNFYMFRINDNNDNYELYKKVNGIMTKVSSGAFTVSLNQAYTLKVVVTGNNIKGYIDEVLQNDWTNATSELTSGYIGFRTHDMASVDNVLVTGALFSDDFEDGDSAGWTKSGGTWSVVSDGTKVLERTSSGSTESYATAGVGWDDYTYQATVKLKTSGGSAGLIFRVTDTNNFYMFRINDNNDNYELYKKVNGTMTKVSSGAFTVSLNQAYTFKVVVTGNNIKGYIDEVLQNDWTNATSELTSGYIGFRTHDMASVDNIVVIN